MIDIINEFGKKAGKIWVTLNTYGPQNQSSLLKNTKLSLSDFYIGIGWLARENKIYRDKLFYNLGETNLTNKIGENAGKVWRLLESQGEIDVTSISKITQVKIQDVYSALGWLAREDKIKTNYENKETKYKLK